MPFKLLTTDVTPSQDLPQDLAHKPFFALPYEEFDGIHAGSSDTIYLSVGLAQYNQEQVSVKAMRHNGQKWNRNSEEVPVHRVIDMTLMVAKAMFDAKGSSLSIAGGCLHRQEATIVVTQEGRSNEECRMFQSFVAEYGSLIKDRLNVLADALNDMRRRGRI